MKIGTRVKLIQEVDNYPTCLIKAGETGTLVGIDETEHESFYWVRLDQYHEELDEWDNQLQIYYDRIWLPEKYHPTKYLEEIR